MEWLEQKYISIISPRLLKFARKNNNIYNFRCPFCGDSKNNPHKARGYIYERKGKGFYSCHNCGINMPFPKLLQSIDPQSYNDFLIEKINQEKDSKPKSDYQIFIDKMKKPTYLKEGVLKDLPKVSQLSPNDPVKKYVVSRQIPNVFHAKLFKCEKIMQFTNRFIPGKFDEKALKYDNTRLLIPFFDRSMYCHAYQGRAIDDDKIRYITIVVDETRPKVWGMERIDPNKNTYVFEGPIDAMFIENSISTAGGDCISMLPSLPIPHDRLIICYDNERHSTETIKKINKAIHHGYRVFIYPDNFEHKDINKAIQSGYNASELNAIIDANIFSGLSAELRLSSYKKV